MAETGPRAAEQAVERTERTQQRVGADQPLTGSAFSRSDRAARRRRLPNRWLPVLIALAVAVGACVMAWQLRETEHRALAAATGSELEEASAKLVECVEEQIHALDRAGRRWMARGDISRAEFEIEASYLMEDFGYLRALERTDSNFVIQWIVSDGDVRNVIGYNIASDTKYRREVEAARDFRAPGLSPPIELLRGGRGFIVSIPLFLGDEFRGFLLGVHTLDDAVGEILRDHAIGYNVRLRSDSGEIWSRGPIDESSHMHRTADVRIRNQTWYLDINPGPDIAAIYQTPLPGIVGLGGCLMALLLGSVTRMAALGRERAARLARTNKALQGEIDRRSRAEASELLANQDLASVLDALPDYVWSAVVGEDQLPKLRYQSHAIAIISGRPASYFEESSEHWTQAIHPEDRERHSQITEELYRGEHSELTLEFRLLRPSGEVRYLRDRIRVSHVEEGLRLDGVLTDETDARLADSARKKLELRLQEAQKLESLGVLAGGIAHDFNNLLVAILGHAGLAQQDLPADSTVRSSVSNIEKAARRAAELCRQMLAYAGMGSFNVGPLNVWEAVQEMGELLRASVPRTIEFEMNSSGDIPSVMGDASQIRQIIMNLITNAAEAIGNHPGRIALEVNGEFFDRSALDEMQLGGGLEPGQYIALRVQDDGCGMDSETRHRIFDPFYTTKFTGRGLGLASALGIVRGHRGALHIESKPDRGCTVTILFPKSDEPARPVVAKTRELDRVPHFGRILLVEDDEAAREVAAVVLDRAGFKVVEANDGVEAVELFAKHVEEIRCVVLDLTMPRMDGEETYRRLREISGSVPVILCSGYPEASAMSRFTEGGLANFLKKPYLPEELIDHILIAIREAEER